MEMFLQETAMHQWQYAASYPTGPPDSQVSIEELASSDFINHNNEVFTLNPTTYWQSQSQVNITQSLWEWNVMSPPSPISKSSAQSGSSTASDSNHLDVELVRPQKEEIVSPKTRRRREQNRQSQRTFRQRQARYIKELEERLQQQTDKYDNLKRVVDELKCQQRGRVESVLEYHQESPLSPPPDEADSDGERLS